MCARVIVRRFDWPIQLLAYACMVRSASGAHKSGGRRADIRSFGRRDDDDEHDETTCWLLAPTTDAELIIWPLFGAEICMQKPWREINSHLGCRVAVHVVVGSEELLICIQTSVFSRARAGHLDTLKL